MTVLNFGIEKAEIRDDLALLRKFRDQYRIDQVFFYTGGNETIYSYRRELQRELGGVEGESIAGNFELFRTFNRLWTKLAGPSEHLLARIDHVVLPRLETSNSLRDGILDAQRYCSTLMMRCDFILQPMLVTRKIFPGREREMREALELLYPRIESAIHRMYAGALASESSKYIQDFSGLFDAVAEPLYFDMSSHQRARQSYRCGAVSSIYTSNHQLGRNRWQQAARFMSPLQRGLSLYFASHCLQPRTKVPRLRRQHSSLRSRL